MSDYSFSQYLKENKNKDHFEFILETYEPYESFQLNENMTNFDVGAKQQSIGNMKKAIEKGVDEHYSKSPEERKKAVEEAKAHFKNTDLRTDEERKYGEDYKKKREEHNSKPENKKNQLSKSIFEEPLIHNGEPITSTKKHKMSDAENAGDYVIPRGPHKGMGANVGGMRLTPGTANLGHGKVLKTCPAATRGCEGSSGERQESGVFKDGLCLAANKGMDTTTNSKRDKLARTRAYALPEHQKHSTTLIANGIEKMHKKAEKENAVAHIRQRDASDIDVIGGVVKKHFGSHPTYMNGAKAKAPVVQYGYSKHVRHNNEGTAIDDNRESASDNTDDDKKHAPKEYIYRSDQGPEFGHDGKPIHGNREKKKATIDHLNSGENAHAYLVAARIRDAVTKGSDSDTLKDVHTVRYHKYDDKGAYEGHEDYDADRNSEHGDLHMYAPTAKRNTTTADGRKKGRVTVTDISGGSNADIHGNEMVHPLHDVQNVHDPKHPHQHVTDDPDHPSKKILHVDPPWIPRKKVIPIHHVSEAISAPAKFNAPKRPNPVDPKSVYDRVVAKQAKREAAKKVTEEYSEKHPKIDLHNRHSGAYIASTNWSPTVKHAVNAYETKNPDMKGHVRGYISDKK